MSKRIPHHRGHRGASAQSPRNAVTAGISTNPISDPDIVVGPNAEAPEAGLLAGRWYANLRTVNNVGGGIRGFPVAVPEPTAALPRLLDLGTIALRGAIPGEVTDASPNSRVDGNSPGENVAPAEKSVREVIASAATATPGNCQAVGSDCKSGPSGIVRNGVRFSFISRASAGSLVALALLAAPQMAVAEPSIAADRGVTYEAFGAVGDGVADDLPAICKAHAHANEHGLPVHSNPAATYHLGRRALTAIIRTSTDWGTSKFIIDDSQGVDDHKQPLFMVRSSLTPVPLEIDRLARGQKRLDLRPPSDCLVRVENDRHRIFIRRGLNQNAGNPQREVFILRKDGSILGDIAWDYDVVTRVIAQPVDPEPLVLRGGVFTQIANRMHQEKGYNYWSRNIEIRRSNTEVDGITLKITGETDVGHPYHGFLSTQDCANITLRDCVIDGHKTYQTIGSAGKPVSMGSYGYLASDVVDFRMIGCRMDDIQDRSRWGVIATNFMKNILLENCVLSRMDVHLGVSGSFIIRRSTLGHAGLNAIGSGQLTLEDCTLHGENLIRFREDYGSTWDGDVLVRNCRWIPPARNAVMFRTDNDGTHDFGYPCVMPRVIRIEGLFVDDSRHKDKHLGVLYFSDPIAGSRPERPFPYRLTGRLEVSDLKTASGLPLRISTNPEVAKVINVVASPAKPAGGFPTK